MLRIANFLGFRSAAYTSALAFSLAAYRNMTVARFDVERPLALAIAGTLLAAYAVTVSDTGSDELNARRRWPTMLPALCVAALLARPASWVVGGNTNGDVRIVTQESVSTLLQGSDPYGKTHVDPNFRDADLVLDGGWGPNASNGRLLVGYPYFPASLLLVTPIGAVADVRCTMVIAIVAGLTLVLYLNPRFTTAILCLLFLFSRATLITIHSAAADNLTFALCAAIAFGAIYKKPWTAYAFGVMLALKQYNILAVPVSAILLSEWSWRTHLRFLGRAFGAATAIVLPFVIWDWRSFLHDTITFHLTKPPRIYSISLATWSGWIPPVGLTLVLAVIVGLWAARSVRSRPSLFPLTFGLVLASFFLLGKQTQPNYFALIAGLMFISAAITAKRKHRRATESS